MYKIVICLIECLLRLLVLPLAMPEANKAIIMIALFVILVERVNRRMF